MTHPRVLLPCLLGSLVFLTSCSSAPNTKHTFAIGRSHFLLDGQQFQIRCGEIHAPRVPPEYWRHRLQMAKAGIEHRLRVSLLEHARTAARGLQLERRSGRSTVLPHRAGGRLMGDSPPRPVCLRRMGGVTAKRQPWRKGFAGLARGFYAGQDGQSGPVEVLALSALGESHFEAETPVAIAFARAALRGKPDAVAREIHYTLDGSEPTTTSPNMKPHFEFETPPPCGQRYSLLANSSSARATTSLKGNS